MIAESLKDSKFLDKRNDMNNLGKSYDVSKT